MSSENSVINVLFVCFGNTCRSPMAEAIFKDLIRKRNLQMQFHIDSAAISNWQEGCDINSCVDIILKRIGIENFLHKARSISYKDYKQFHYMFGMDYFHIEEMINAAEALKSETKIYLLGEFNPNKNCKIIRDPIGGRMEEFEKCYEQIFVSCKVLLDKLIEKSI